MAREGRSSAGPSANVEGPIVQGLSHRLLAVRWLGVRSPDVIADHRADVRAFASKAGTRIVVLSDCRHLTVMDDDTATAMGQLLQGDNPLLERSAIVLGTATTHLQFARLIREAANPNRQGFRDPGAALAWLAEILREGELANARDFLTSELS